MAGCFFTKSINFYFSHLPAESVNAEQAGINADSFQDFLNNLYAYTE